MYRIRSRKYQKQLNVFKIHSLLHFVLKLKEFRSIRSDQLTMSLPRSNEVDPRQRCPGTTNYHVKRGNTCPGAIITSGVVHCSEFM